MVIIREVISHDTQKEINIELFSWIIIGNFNDRIHIVQYGCYSIIK